MTEKKILNSEEASEIIAKLGLEFAVIRNPAPLYPEIELFPLAPKITAPQKELSAVIMDLEGTVCSTQELRLNSLEYVIRSISGRNSKEEWKGLDPLIDQPNLLGISIPEAVRYLVQRYHNFIKAEELKTAYLHSVLWTIILSRSQERRSEVRKNLEQLGLGEMLKDAKLEELTLQKEFNKYNSNVITSYFLHKYGSRLNLQNFDQTVRASTEIFFQHYYQMLELIRYGEASSLAEEISGQEDTPLIKPMPSIPLLFALVKGWLGEDVTYLYDEISSELKAKSSQVYRISSQEDAKLKLKKLAEHFQLHPLKIAIVTSSASYEADIVLGELFNTVSHEIRKWKLPQEKKEVLLERFSDYKSVVDVFTTSNDASKIRPKPHRDLYSAALSQLAFPQNMFNRILGFENTEQGIIALRASGLGLVAAVPYNRNSRHDFSSAAFILPGGITEAILNYNLFISL